MDLGPTTILQPRSQEEWIKILSSLVSPEFEPKMRRRYRRYTVFGEVRAEWTYEDRQFRRSWELTEVSAGGITTRSYQECPVGVRMNLEIRIEDTQVSLPGRLVHATQTLGGYKLGIKLEFNEFDAAEGSDE